MGQFESTQRIFKSNDELINSLIKRKFIHSINVEKVLRSVDRGLYYTGNELNAYADMHSGDEHLSAPRVYATALECLDLHKGHKFLNIGSGIGYFSTLAGLLLGINGVNHGIEINSSTIDIAYQKLELFKKNAAAIDYFEFCEPVFIKGNAYELMSVGYYDRVYCGAQVPRAKFQFMRALIKIGGVLVMPFKCIIVKVTRKSEYLWEVIEVLGLGIDDLVAEEKCSIMKVLKFPTVEPLSLKVLCRSIIRASIRDCLIESHPGLQMLTKCEPSTISYHQKMFSSTKFRRSFINELDLVVEESSDPDSTSENDSIEEDNDDHVEEKNTSEQCDKNLLEKTASDNKREESEAGCSGQNNTLPENPEKPKRMKMDTISSTFKYTSEAHCTFLEAMLAESSSSESDDEENERNIEDKNKIHKDLADGKINIDRDIDSEDARELIRYRFLSNHNENELCKILKVKIDQLPVPDMLKLFLNYNKED